MALRAGLPVILDAFRATQPPEDFPAGRLRRFFTARPNREAAALIEASAYEVGHD